MATRYSASSRYQLDDGGMWASRKTIPDRTYVVYAIKGGDTIENIAHRLLGDATRWWEIADLNPQLESFLTLVPGQQIRTPA